MFDRGRQKNKAGTMPDNLRTSVSGRICCFHCPPSWDNQKSARFLFWESPTYGILLYCWKGLALVSLFMSTLQFAFTVYNSTDESTKKKNK